MTCYVYLISCNPKKSRPYVKIGMTSDPQKRMNTLQTGNPHELRMLACIPCKDRPEARHLESFIHKKLGASRCIGEWFKANGGDLNFALHEMAKMKGIDEIIDARVKYEFNSTMREREKRCRKENERLKKANRGLLEQIKSSNEVRNKKILILRGWVNALGVDYKDIDSTIKREMKDK